MSPILYLDYNCFQRGFDDHRQVRIRMEAEACERIFEEAESGKVELVWSFMHGDENRLCPFPERQIEIAHLASICRIRVGPKEAIRSAAQAFHAAGIPAKDALHLAAAEHAKVDWFVTCDDQLMARSARLKVAVRTVNPVTYVAARW